MDLLSVIANSRRRSTFTGLLDIYPGAAAAYSMRCLNSLFLDDWFVQVRRASDNDEVQVKYDQSIAIPRLSLNSPLVASGATFGDFVSGTDGFVPDWRDVSGNGRNATQATAGNQPQIVAGGALVTDGMSFSSQYLDATVPYQNGTVASVAKANVAGEGSRYIYNGQWSTTPAHLLGSRSTGANLIYQGGVIGAGVLSNAEQLRVGIFDTTDSLYINGSLIASGNAGTLSFLADQLRVGASWNGGQKELIFWPTFPSRTAIEANINAAWSIF